MRETGERRKCSSHKFTLLCNTSLQFHPKHRGDLEYVCRRNLSTGCTASYPVMDTEKKVAAVWKKYSFDPSNFAHVMYLAVGALLAIILFAAVVVGWRSKKSHTPPFTPHPTARLHRGASSKWLG